MPTNHSILTILPPNFDRVLSVDSKDQQAFLGRPFRIASNTPTREGEITTLSDFSPQSFMKHCIRAGFQKLRSRVLSRDERPQFGTTFGEKKFQLGRQFAHSNRQFAGRSADLEVRRPVRVPQIVILVILVIQCSYPAARELGPMDQPV